MRLARLPRPRRAIGLTPMVDVLMILLVFFMVTSTYLDLDMLPLGARDAEAAPQTGTRPVQAPRAMLLRLGADGRVWHQGQVLSPDGLRDLIAAGSAPEVLLLPAPQAPVQALVRVMDAAEAAGTARLRVIRLEPR